MKASNLPTIKGQPTDGEELIFNAPWEAKTFAMTVHLHEKGLFSWSEWADTLSREISTHESSGAVVCSESYYRLWQQALEKILSKKVHLQSGV